MSRLRRSLGTGSGSVDVLITEAPGYRLAVEPDQIDARRFADLAARGKAPLTTDPAAAAATLQEAQDPGRALINGYYASHFVNFYKISVLAEFLWLL